MTSIFEVLVLDKQYAAARAALRGIIESMVAAGWQTMKLRTDVGPVALRKNAVVTFEHANEGTRFDEVWSIHWEPENGGPFPDFTGWLSVQYAPGGLAQLEIRGEYAPPLGAVGKGFDLILGQRIASETCKNLLAELAELVQDRAQTA